MSDEIFPHLRVLFARTFPSIGWPSGYHREDEAKSAVERKASELIETYGISDLVRPDSFSDFLYADMKAKAVVREHQERFAGKYVNFSDAQFRQYTTKIDGTDPLAGAANRIGKRFFPDVFQGYRAQLAGDLGKPIPSEVIRSQPWSTLEISKPTLAEIKERADGLIAAIEQADLDEKQRANALAHARAVLTLIDAPNPPWKVVVELLNNPVLSAILNALTIVQLIMGSFS